MASMLTAIGVPLLIVGLLALGLSGNKRMRFKSFLFLLGALLVLTGSGAEVAALAANHASQPSPDAADD